MAAGAWAEIPGTRKITQGADNIVATRFYQSLADAQSDTEYDVLNASGSFKIRDVYPANGFLRVKNISVVQSAGEPLKWIITVVFSTSVPEDADETSDDPLNRPPGLSIVQISQNEPVTVLPDYFNINSGLEIVTENSAKITYDPPIEREVVDLAIVVTQNFDDFRPADVNGFQAAVNSEPWEGFDRGLARIINIAFEELTENGITFWQRTIEIHTRIKPDNYIWNDSTKEYIYPWQTIRENKGVQQLTTEGDGYEPILASNDWLVVEPVGLTATGRSQAPNVTPTLLRWNVYPRKDFSDLDILLD